MKVCSGCGVSHELKNFAEFMRAMAAATRLAPAVVAELEQIATKHELSNYAIFEALGQFRMATETIDRIGECLHRSVRVMSEAAQLEEEMSETAQ